MLTSMKVHSTPLYSYFEIYCALTLKSFTNSKEPDELSIPISTVSFMLTSVSAEYFCLGCIPVVPELREDYTAIQAIELLN